MASADQKCQMMKMVIFIMASGDYNDPWWNIAPNYKNDIK